jgi:hypothetical protein
VTAAGNLAGKAWRRASALPGRGAQFARRTARACEHLRALRIEWQLEQQIARVARGNRPILAGPWVSEVGFEVLYWIPFLRWFEDRFRVDRERVIAVSRGGVRSWYADVAAQYVDILDHLDLDTFGRRNAERRDTEAGSHKQKKPGSFDRDVLAAARDVIGVEDATVLHPSLMYRLFNPFWYGDRALDLVMSHTRHVPLHVPANHGLDLPDGYIAVKFYTGEAVPGTQENRCGLDGLVRALARHQPVVLLDTGLTVDEHEDYAFRDVPNVASVRAQLTPATNLGTQTAVIAGAQAFVGTCGSLAWLAPMLGVRTIAVYAEDRFLLSHIMFATQVYRQMAAARFETLDLRAALQLELLAAFEPAVSRAR